MLSIPEHGRVEYVHMLAMSANQELSTVRPAALGSRPYIAGALLAKLGFDQGPIGLKFTSGATFLLAQLRLPSNLRSLRA